MTRKVFIALIILTAILSAQTNDSIPQKKVKSFQYHKSPNLAMLLSAVIPAGGQLYCKDYIKSLMIIGAEGALGYYAYKNHRDYQTLGDDKYRQSRNNLLWWLATVKVISIADAYVTANLYKFNEQMKLGMATDGYSVGFGLAWKTNLWDR